MKVAELGQKRPGEASEAIRHRVVSARERQAKRFTKRTGLFANADMQSKEIREFCRIDSDGEGLLKMAMTKLGLSARAYDRILKVARTIADLGASDGVWTDHLGEEIQCKGLDRNLWMS